VINSFAQGPDVQRVFPPFRDVTYCRNTFQLTLEDCYSGLLAGHRQGWYNSKTFSAEQFEAWAEPSYFDMHIITPKFLAFRGPKAANHDRFPDASRYKDEFLKIGVTGVIRLNEPEPYPASVFTDAGIAHYELYFDDCTMPPPHIAKKFLDICDQHRGMLAVHCLAGLGRTGTLICMWIMKHKGWTARQAIAWCRICRPGSVIGPQQHYLEVYEQNLINDNGRLPELHEVSLPDTVDSTAQASAQIGRDVEEGMMRRADQRSAAVEMAEMTRNVERARTNLNVDMERSGIVQLLDGAMPGLEEEAAEEELDLGIYEQAVWGEMLTTGTVTEI